MVLDWRLRSGLFQSSNDVAYVGDMPRTPNATFSHSLSDDMFSPTKISSSESGYLRFGRPASSGMLCNAYQEHTVQRVLFVISKLFAARFLTLFDVQGISS